MNQQEPRRDEIFLTGVRLATNLGVPDEERRLAQTVEVSVVLVPAGGCPGVGDDLRNTVDYAAVWNRLREVAGERPRKLVETLANEMAEALLREFPVTEIGIEIRKAILPGVESAGVRIWRRQKVD